MKSASILLGLSVAANVALAALVWNRTMPADFPAETESSQGGPAQASATKSSSAGTGVDRAAQELAAADRAYAARLQADGFPPHIVRFLVMTRLNKRYEARRSALRAAPPNRFSSGGELPFARRFVPKGWEASRELEREYQQELLAALGGNEGLSATEIALRERKLGNLPPEKLRQVERITKDYGELRSSVRIEAAGIMTKADRERLRLIDREERTDLAGILTADELLEYDLRNSQGAVNLRGRLRHFDPTESEYRALAQLQLELDRQYGTSALSIDEQAQRRAADAALAPRIQAALTPDRYATYQIRIDGSYSEHTRFVSSYGLPESTADQFVGWKQEFTRRGDEIRNNPALTPADKKNQLAQLASEASGRFTAQLGADTFEKYRRSAGNWMRGLEAPAANPNRP